jgi:hypothetical protein
MKKSTSDLFVSYRYGDDIYDVFTTLKEAEKATYSSSNLSIYSLIYFINYIYLLLFLISNHQFHPE